MIFFTLSDKVKEVSELACETQGGSQRVCVCGSCLLLQKVPEKRFLCYIGV